MQRRRTEMVVAGTAEAAAEATFAAAAQARVQRLDDIGHDAGQRQTRRAAGTFLLLGLRRQLSIPRLYTLLLHG